MAILSGLIVFAAVMALAEARRNEWLQHHNYPIDYGHLYNEDVFWDSPYYDDAPDYDSRMLNEWGHHRPTMPPHYPYPQQWQQPTMPPQGLPGGPPMYSHDWRRVINPYTGEWREQGNY